MTLVFRQTRSFSKTWGFILIWILAFESIRVICCYLMRLINLELLLLSFSCAAWLSFHDLFPFESLNVVWVTLFFVISMSVDTLGSILLIINHGSTDVKVNYWANSTSVARSLWGMRLIVCTLLRRDAYQSHSSVRVWDSQLASEVRLNLKRFLLPWLKLTEIHIYLIFREGLILFRRANNFWFDKSAVQVIGLCWDIKESGIRPRKMDSSLSNILRVILKRLKGALFDLNGSMIVVFHDAFSHIFPEGSILQLLTLPVSQSVWNSLQGKVFLTVFLKYNLLCMIRGWIYDKDWAVLVETSRARLDLTSLERIFTSLTGMTKSGATRSVTEID